MISSRSRYCVIAATLLIASNQVAAAPMNAPAATPSEDGATLRPDGRSPLLAKNVRKKKKKKKQPVPADDQSSEMTTSPDEPQAADVVDDGEASGGDEGDSQQAASGIGVSAGFAFETLTFKQAKDTDETGPAFHVLGRKSFPAMDKGSVPVTAGLHHAEWGGGSGEGVTLNQSVTSLELGAGFAYELSPSLTLGLALQYLYGLTGTAEVEFSGPAAELGASNVSADMDSSSRFGYGFELGWTKSRHSLLSFNYYMFSGSMAFKSSGVTTEADFDGSAFRFSYTYLL